LAAAIRDIHSDPRGPLFQRFLKDGPYENGDGEIPRELEGRRLSDEETTRIIAFIYSHMVNCFQGALMEMLATAPCLRLLRELQEGGRLPGGARLYVGDVVLAPRSRGSGFAKSADLHILVGHDPSQPLSTVAVAGVAEVKSYFCPSKRVRRQLRQHLARARRGLRVGDVVHPPSRIGVGCGPKRDAVRIAVLPARWRLPRTFHFEQGDAGRLLQVDPGSPPSRTDSTVRTGEDEWRITLRWSREALAAAAYELTFWYMERVGEAIYSDGVPEEWSEMTPAEAGRNAAKMMLYYAIARCRTERENQRAIALYNSYGFGYALGMNFRDPDGRREMLWPEDLDEIAASGQTKRGCRVV